MTTERQELYAFLQLSLIDMERARKSIGCIENTDDEYLKDALLRDAVISYAKPFSANFGLANSRMRLRNDFVPTHLEDRHNEIRDIRNQLLAHNDLTWQKVEFGPGTGFTVRGYETVFLSHLFDPLKELANAVHESIQCRMDEMKKDGL